MPFRVRDYSDYSGALQVATASGDTSTLYASGAVVWCVSFNHKGTASAQFELNDNSGSGARDSLKLTGVISAGNLQLIYQPSRPIHFDKGIIYFVTGTGARVEVGYLPLI